MPKTEATMSNTNQKTANGKTANDNKNTDSKTESGSESDGEKKKVAKTEVDNFGVELTGKLSSSEFDVKILPDGSGIFVTLTKIGVGFILNGNADSGYKTAQRYNAHSKRWENLVRLTSESLGQIKKLAINKEADSDYGSVAYYKRVAAEAAAAAAAAEKAEAEAKAKAEKEAHKK